MQRIFIVGCPRSGTTLAQSLLVSAPGMTGFTESHFFDKCFPSPYNPFRVNGYDRDCVRATIERFNRENELQEHRLDAAMDDAVKSSGRFFVEKLDDASASRSATGWIEKTPDHLFRIELIRSSAADVTFVHVLRNPADTIASLQRASRQWGRPRSWLAFAVKWCLCASISSSYLGKPGHVHVFYEDIVADSRDQGRKLFDRLNLDWDDGVLERYTDAARSVIAEDEEWKENNLREIGQNTGRQLQHNRLQLTLLKILERQYRSIRDNAARYG